jgi:hypothetical protein
MNRFAGFWALSSSLPQDEFDAAAHHALARKVAGEGMVLLKTTGFCL